jgi:hypothetical protein
MAYGITLPSLSNNATKFTLGGPQGTVPYGDVLFTATIVGQNSKTNKDSNHTLLSTLHHFTYDTDFYVTNVAITQSLEFDVNLWLDNIAGMIFGTQCNNLGDHSWDIWNSKTGHWISAGVPCKFIKGWNHVTIRVERLADNSTLYQSITLNGTTYTLNKSYPPRDCPAGWWGFDVNYQMDGNYQQAANTTYLDNLNVTYW